MRYAFVCATIFVIWVSIILMSLVATKSSAEFLHYAALILTVVLFYIGFRKK